MISPFGRRGWWWAGALGLVVGVLATTFGPAPPKPDAPGSFSPASPSDPRLGPLREAAAGWEGRPGPERAVVDQVCLVPDVATFLEAVATWDRGHYFPILIDDVESTFRFVRAFRPARIVRFPRAAPPIPPDRLWARAVSAVGSSWKADPAPSAKPKGDVVPKGMGPTPPGVVISSPKAPMLAGAVALAAGRFQPLLRLDSGPGFDDQLGFDEMGAFDRMVTATIRDRVPLFDRLGDDCDFVTLAGDYPYRYKDAKGDLNSVDDRLGRSAETMRRWAFAGRLLGDPGESVYRAMCGLFLQPESAVMFNGYEEGKPPWSDYSMRDAAVRLSRSLPTSHVSGDRQSDIGGWHETFDPENRFGLVFINSSGGPTAFATKDGQGTAADVPRGVPTAVLMIHSFSASSPTEPRTIAGRWMANGAFVYFGSVNEPYVQAFRTPRLVGELIGEHLPIAAAVRVSPGEPFGTPWRLAFLGDPLYRLKPKSGSAPRSARWEPTVDWPAYSEAPRAANSSDEATFLWALKAALARLQAVRPPAPGDDLVEALLGVRRGRLPAPFRPVYDALLVEILLQAKRRTTLRARIAAIPEAERSPVLGRTEETLFAADLALAIGQPEPAKARGVWSALVRSAVGTDLKDMATGRVGRLADSPARRREWADLLRATLRERPKAPEAEALAAELKRVEEASRGDGKPPAGD